MLSSIIGVAIIVYGFLVLLRPHVTVSRLGANLIGHWINVGGMGK